MPSPAYLIFYVDNAPTSAEHYAKLLARSPIENSPDFALFVLDSGTKLGLWTRPAVEPPIAISGCSSEIALPVADRAHVDTLYGEWRHQGVVIAQEPTEMDFGYSFVALDPDGHRLRVFARAVR